MVSGSLANMPATMGVSMAPGQTALMRMPLEAFRAQHSSSARVLRVWMHDTLLGRVYRSDRRLRSS